MCALILGGISCCLPALAETPPPLISADGCKIVSLDIRNDVPGFPVMSFYARYPKGLSPGDKVDGVFAYAEYFAKKKTLEDWIKNPIASDPYFQFADKHRLLLLSWTVAVVYDDGNSFDRDQSDERDPNNPMETCFRTWKVGVDRLSRMYKLPNSGFLINGLSCGAQWAHRLVLRSPEKFAAVQIHVNSSFEEPTPDASHCLWLVTTGELEYGCKAARVFYEKARALNYPILLRIYPGRGHEDVAEAKALGVSFFEYAFKLRADQAKLNAAKAAKRLVISDEDAPIILDQSLLQSFRQPPFYGDMLNGDVYPSSEAAYLPKTERVGLPDLELAKNWGYFHSE